MNKIIKILAPCNGEIKKIEDLNDGAFSEKMLGDGFYIEPSNGEFYSPFEQSTLVNIFETKHAFHFKHKEGPIALVHIGLDTVKLKGTPFNLKQTVNKVVNSTDLIVEVNIEEISSKNIKLSTPVVFEFEDKNYKINLLKVGKVKVGEVVAELEEITYLKQKNILDFLDRKNTFDNKAEIIFKSVGTNINVKEAYNCMTRFRLNIKNKELVNETEIKNIDIVKGINWSGNELQIIIGGDAVKVKDAFLKITDQIQNKTHFDTRSNVKFKNFKRSALGFISGVVIPVLPIMIAAGLLKAIQSVLEQFGAISKISLGIGSPPITDYDLFSILVFSIANIGLAFIGVAFIVSTVKYFKGNIMIAMFIGLALMNPYFTNGIRITLFSIGEVDINIQSYGSSVMPMVAAGVIYVFFDRWVQKWMPTTVDIIFRPLLGFLVTILIILFVFGPILGIVESGIYYAITWIGKIPYGIGSGLFAFCWQFLVITGLHNAIIGFINVSISNGNPTVLGLCLTITVFSQMGAGIGVLLKQKNSMTSKEIIASIPPALCGITEPMIYGINFPRFKPFLYGCVAAGIGGLFIGAFGLTSYTVSAGGLFAIIRVVEGGAYDISMYIVGWIITIVLGICLTYFFYKEKESELNLIKKVNKKLVNIIKKEQKLNTKKAETLLFDLIKLLKDEMNEQNKNLLLEFDKILEKYNKLKASFENKINKRNQKEQNLIKKARKLKLSEEINKLKIINDKFNLLLNDQKIAILEKDLNENALKLEILKNDVSKFQDNFMGKISEQLIKLDSQIVNKMTSSYYNAIHATDIYYNLSQKI